MKSEPFLLMLPLMVVAFGLAEYVSEYKLPFWARLALAAFLVVTILWRYLHISPKTMTQWAYRKFHRAGSGRSAMWFAAAYGCGLVCMALACRVLQVLTQDLTGEFVFFAFLWPILAMPAIFVSASIWVTSRRDQVMPTVASMTAIFTAVAAVFFAFAMRNGGGNDLAVLIQSLIGLHGVLILILVPIIRWWFRRKTHRFPQNTSIPP
jgi:hypothetical protein